MPRLELQPQGYYFSTHDVLSIVYWAPFLEYSHATFLNQQPIHHRWYDQQRPLQNLLSHHLRSRGTQRPKGASWRALNPDLRLLHQRRSAHDLEFERQKPL